MERRPSQFVGLRRARTRKHEDLTIPSFLGARTPNLGIRMFINLALWGPLEGKHLMLKVKEVWLSGCAVLGLQMSMMLGRVSPT